MHAAGRGAIKHLRAAAPANDDDVLTMRLIDELFMAWPFLGSRRLASCCGERLFDHRKRVQRLMRQMGIAALGEAATTKAGARTQDLPVSPAQSGDRPAKPGLGRPHHLHPGRARVPLPRRRHRLGEPGGAGVAAVEYDGCVVLRVGARGGAGSLRQAGNLSTPTKAASSPARPSPAR